MPVAVYDFSIRDFTARMACEFCAECEFVRRGGCDARTAHTYGCFEAERWNGLYVYYCPMSLTFVATVVFEGWRAAYAIVTGPAVMDTLDDILIEAGGLPRRTPPAINALSRIQWLVATQLSGRSIIEAEAQLKNQASLHNALYDVTEKMRSGQETRYPMEIEKRLQKMIMYGNKEEARELINELLGSVYFSSIGDLARIREHAKELVILFSRASIDGGADVRQIFGHNRDCLDKIDRCRTLDELSELLIAIFYRFVGYVFDFSRFEHADIIGKAVNFLRENISDKVTLEDAAAHVRLSSGYLGNLFRTELGATFTDFLNRMRVEKSKELLLNPDLSLADIANLVGYSDQSYYTKKFMGLVGVSPGKYRKKRRQPDEPTCLGFNPHPDGIQTNP
jgi:AraC-like DNA-binding protein